MGARTNEETTMQPWRQRAPDDKKAIVRVAIEDGQSYSDIARAYGCSRQAIAGVVNRMSDKPAKQRKIKPIKPPKAPKAARKFNGFSTLGHGELDTAPVPADAWAPLPGSTPKTLDQIQHGDCRWPVGDPALFCAEPADGEHVYCAAHCRRAYRVPEERRK